MLDWIVDRLKEPSTWAGLGTLLVVNGVALPPGVMPLVVQAGVSIAGILAIVIHEKPAVTVVRR